MRKLLCVALLAACELQPAPKQAPAPAPTPAPANPVATPPPTPADAGAGSAARIEISPECLQVGAKVAQVFIDSAKDPGQKSIYEQERANMTRRTGEACTTQGWSDGARKCYLRTKTPADIKSCELAHTPPQAPSPAAPSAAAPSAAPDPAPAPGEPRPRAEPRPGTR